MRCKAKTGSNAQRTREYVSISRRFSTPQRAARGFFNSLLVGAVIVFAGMYAANASERIRPTTSIDSLRLEVTWVESREELTEVVKRYGADRRSAAYANGFSVLVKVDGELVCRLFVKAPQRVDDDRTLTLGHELMHCLAGAYHE